jgi:CheY-like chemotaxis protein
MQKSEHPVVLIISQDLPKIQILKKALKEKFHVLSKPQATLGLETAKATLLDAIVIDSKIADMPVATLCQEIRKIAAYFETPIIVITQSLKKSFINPIKQAGATTFLNEPLDPVEIATALAQALRIKAREKTISSLGNRMSKKKS